ncbi:MAG: hypothetical protein EOO88_54435, partial [Pedobacter sp.]
MKNYMPLLCALLLLACNAKSNKNEQTALKADSSTIEQIVELIDLAKLKLNENFSTLMKGQSVKTETLDPTENTLMGYEAFKSSNPNVLRFQGTAFSGSKNHVIFHYQNGKGILAC